ncbi:hypothetical protein IQ255_02640 [Pleurocapsales cyanobacterium LEGE 10410]|nr:hypothetical protein [Pleurocapsales cyanobacterium LEGE 10410]
MTSVLTGNNRNLKTIAVVIPNPIDEVQDRRSSSPPELESDPACVLRAWECAVGFPKGYRSAYRGLF